MADCTIEQCSNCRETKLYSRGLPCGRYLCFDCCEEVKCPCEKCQPLPAFVPLRICSLCKTKLSPQEAEIDHRICRACKNKLVEDTSILGPLYRLLSKISLCGGQYPLPEEPKIIAPKPAPTKPVKPPFLENHVRKIENACRVRGDIAISDSDILGPIRDAGGL